MKRESLRGLQMPNSAHEGVPWRCPTCGALLGVEQEGWLHIRFKTSKVSAQGVITVTCRRCGGRHTYRVPVPPMSESAVA